METRLEQASVIGEEMALAFADGTELYLPLAMLRRACPCAVCQGEPDALGRVVKPKVEYGPRSFELVRFEVVGGYALQLHWADGHGYGIYTFPYLLKLGALEAG
ncbi:MAG: DUF971 domain-containing protein [Verrucomicrobia bacterium]|nr:DUF971 domain-containing protein [Verrucomicrobiota bacterium]